MVGYLFGLIDCVRKGTFTLWAGKKLTSEAQPSVQPVAARAARVTPSASHAAMPAVRSAAPEVVRSHLDAIRSVPHMPAKAGNLAAELMQGGHWQTSTA